MTSNEPHQPDRFEQLADERPPSYMQEVWYLVVSHRRLIIAPVVIAIVVLGLLVMLAGTGAAPFIYTLF